MKCIFVLQEDKQENKNLRQNNQKQKAQIKKIRMKVGHFNR